ncbi:MAG: lipocalin family protein [Leptospiraceae bacterium]|nr:lipocalin family protein [Leptospiraceae bacterium]
MGLPEGITPVADFQLDRYLGRWYEIARLDHSFERQLTHVSAQYSRRADGGVRVINRGYHAVDQEWRVAEGRAYPVESVDVGYFKVSFFGPFYGSYVIFELDKKDYTYAYVTSSDRDWLWFLSRTPTISAAARQQFVDQAAKSGFAVDELIFVDQSGQPAGGPR